MKIIDPHIHLFNLEQGDYHWLKADNPPFWSDKYLINKTFTEKDLSLDLPLALAAFVHIEAGFDNNKPWRELAALEHNCNETYKAIASIDLTASSNGFAHYLELLAEHRSFIGVRHILDEQALKLLTDKQVITNFKNLNDFAKNSNQDLVFETQLILYENTAVNALCDVISDNPDISFIINHAGFPPADIQEKQWLYWQNNLLKLATFSHVAMKCSGWEMTDRHYQPAWLNENLTLIFKYFGVKNMMLASNFPLCLFSHKSYQTYWQSIITSDFFQALTKQEKSALCYDNALCWYSIPL
jgi:predicted TIM-barrel fold metal-dependent hydrolase